MAANAKDQASFTSSEHQVTNAVQQQDVESAKAFNESDIEDMNMQVQEMTVDRETYSSEYAGVTPGREKERRLRRQSQEKTTVRTRRRKKMSIYKAAQIMRWMSNWSSTESEEDGNEPSMKARRISFAPAAPPPSPTELGASSLDDNKPKSSESTPPPIHHELLAKKQ